MQMRKHYSDAKYSEATVAQWQKEFFRLGGPSLQLLVDMMDDAPGIAFFLKNAQGRIMHVNEYNIRLSGWHSIKDLLGYTSEELYPPDLAAVYGGRDREVMETGVPIVKRIYGFVADRSPALNCVTVRPIEGTNGQRIGTATVYWRADSKLKTANWYDPIRKAVVYLNEHINENITVPQLAKLSNYSEAQFRRLFKELTQLTPSEYIQLTRVNTAKTLLSTTDKLITDIANEIGFYDHAHFNRTFRTLTGQTPAAYRRQTQK